MKPILFALLLSTTISSFGYIRCENGDLKINLHHSSLPYQAQ